MYECPIEMIYGELQTQMMQEDEKLVMKAVRNVGVNVDKGALIKALQYDRHQYAKGYEDGKNEVLDKVKEVVCKWKADNFTDGFAWDCMNEIADIVDETEKRLKKEAAGQNE